MPMSSAEGKDWTRDRVLALATDGPITVLDIGPGVGTYAKLLAGPQVSRLTGIEILEPYVHTYRLREYYDEIIIGDARRWTAGRRRGDPGRRGRAHDAEDAALLCGSGPSAAARKAVYLSIPIIHYPQGRSRATRTSTTWSTTGTTTRCSRPSTASPSGGWAPRSGSTSG